MRGCAFSIKQCWVYSGSTLDYSESHLPAPEPFGVLFGRDELLLVRVLLRKDAL